MSVIELPSANLQEMQIWAQSVMDERAPDFVIGDDYLRRWFIVPRNPWCNIYLHMILRSDDDRALHDHPWDNTSFIISGRYFEHTPSSIFHRTAGSVVSRKASQLHRLVIPDDEPYALSLFMTGPKIRDWGFACPKGWVPWQDFVGDDPGQVGRGCGELS